ncbi:MAG: hypothetical protein AAFO69_17275 [Bacteroidota bacterium]
MLKKVLNIKNAKQLSKNEQKEVNGGFPSLPGGDCCACVFRPAANPYDPFSYPFPILITQPCDLPCPVDGATDWQDTGC